MDLTQLANLGEFVGGVAVLVTLIYLAVQVREGRRDLRLQSEFSMADRLAQTAFQYSLSPELARSIEHSLTTPDSLTEEERRSAMWIIVAFFHGVDAMYLRYLEGVISSEAWAPQERIVSGLLQSPFTRRWWATKQSLAFSDRFRAFIENKLASPAEVLLALLERQLEASPDRLVPAHRLPKGAGCLLIEMQRSRRILMGHRRSELWNGGLHESPNSPSVTNRLPDLFEFFRHQFWTQTALGKSGAGLLVQSTPVLPLLLTLHHVGLRFQVHHQLFGRSVLAEQQTLENGPRHGVIVAGNAD